MMSHDCSLASDLVKARDHLVRFSTKQIGDMLFVTRLFHCEIVVVAVHAHDHVIGLFSY